MKLKDKVKLKTSDRSANILQQWQKKHIFGVEV